MNEDYIKGILFIIIGVTLLLYIVFKPKANSKPWDLKGKVGSVISILFGLYLIFKNF